jgi:phage head maturation protease
MNENPKALIARLEQAALDADLAEAERIIRLGELERQAAAPFASYQVLVAYADALEQDIKLTTLRREARIEREARDAEQQLIMRRASNSVIHKPATISRSSGLPSFVFTKASLDRMGDVVEPAGVNFKNFVKTGGPCLYNHREPMVGNWKNVRLTGDALVGDLKMAPRGISERIDEVIGLVEASVITSCSIGFYALETKPLPSGGNHFVKSELCEVSLTPTPANADAVAIARAANRLPQSTEDEFATEGLVEVLASEVGRAMGSLEREVKLEIAHLRSLLEKKDK